MAKNNFTFQTAIKLNSAGFKKGVKDVQKTLKSLQSSFMSLAGALGLGLSFGKLVSEAKKTATELSVAMAVLENASKVTNKAGETVDNYATNLQFVRGIAKKYKQDFVELINTFGQFTAAANQVKDANGDIALSLEDQKYIYEQLTRAAAGYHMSADRTRDMMNAIVQMMSKGKVAAEELRRQLGNALPGAFGIMAAAMGVSNAELEEMMKKGEVLAADALPRFAKMLEGITEHMSFDSLQSSTNELKNAWTELIEEMNVSSGIKMLTDNLTQFVNWIRKNLNGIVATIKGILVGSLFPIIGRGIDSVYGKWTTRNEAIIKQYETLMKQSKMLEKRLSSGIQAGSKTITTSRAKTSGGHFEYYESFAGGRVTSDDFADAAGVKKFMDEKTNMAEAMRSYNKALLEMDKLQKRLGNKGLLSKKDVQNIKRANTHMSNLVKIGNEGFTGLRNKTTLLTKAWTGFKGILFGIKEAIVSIGVSMAAMAIIGVIVGWITKIHQEAKFWREEQERINNIVPNFEKSMNNIKTGTTQTATNLKKLTDSLKGMDPGSKEYASKIQEINKQLGLTGDAAFTIKSAYEDIVKEVDKWIDKQRAIATINKALASQDEASARNMQLSDQLDEAFDDFYKKFKKGGRGYIDIYTGNLKNLGDLSTREKNWITKNIKPIIQEMQANRRVIEKAESEVAAQRKALADKYGVDVTGENLLNPDDNPDKDKGPKVATPSSVMEDYLKKRKELDNQLKNGALTEEEFKEKIMELEDETFKAISAFDEWDKVMSKLSKSSREEAERLKEVYPENQQARKDKSDKAEAEKKAKAEAEATKKAIEEQLKALDELRVPKQKKRDTTYDYSREPLDIQKEIADLKSDQAEALREIIDSLKEGIVSGNFDLVKQDAINKLFELVAALQAVKREATDLQKKVKLSEAIDELNKRIKEMEEDTFSNFTSIAESFDRVNNSLLSMVQLFDEDLRDSELFKAYEVFSTMLNNSIQIMEAIGSVIKTVQAISDLAAKKKVKDAAMEVAANKAATASEIEKATAAAGAAAAGGASAVAGIPFVGPALAIAAAASIAAAILAAMSKFATGGFVGGNSYTGDKQMVRVNSGELILNPSQQKNLLALANGKGKSSGGSVDFRIRGTDLVGVLNNEMSRRKG